MGTFNLAIQYPDAQQARIVAALRTHFAVDGVLPTTQEAIESLRQSLANAVRDIVLRVERDAARAAADAGVQAPDVT